MTKGEFITNHLLEPKVTLSSKNELDSLGDDFPEMAISKPVKAVEEKPRIIKKSVYKCKQLF